MQTRRIYFTCRCGRRLAAVIHGDPPRFDLEDHGERLHERLCPTPGCRWDYRRMSVEELKENIFRSI